MIWQSAWFMLSGFFFYRPHVRFVTCGARLGRIHAPEQILGSFFGS